MPIAFLALFLGVSAAWLYGAQLEKLAAVRTLRQLPLADNMLLWHQAAVVWRQGHPGFAGAIPASGLILPEWYVAMASWHSASDAGGALSTYATAMDGIDPGRLAAELAVTTSNEVNAGLAAGGFVVPPLRSASISAPVGVPDGAAILVTLVRP